MADGQDELVGIARALINRTGRRLRQKAGRSLDDASRALSVYKGTVSRWETGHRVPRPELALRYADVLADWVGRS